MALLRPTALPRGLELEIHVPVEDSRKGVDVRLLSPFIFLLTLLFLWRKRFQVAVNSWAVFFALQGGGNCRRLRHEMEDKRDGGVR